MKQVIEIVDDNEQKAEYGLSASSLVQEGNDDVINTPVQVPKKRGPGRPPKNQSSTSNTYTDIVVADKKRNTPDSLIKEYEKGYFDNAKLLYGAIAQTEQVYKNIEEELDKYRTNRAYGGKNRAMNISQFMSTQVGVISTKINAVRELNSVRNKINDLVMKKEQLLKDTGEDNADKNIMDAYYALVNAPRYGLPAFNQQLSPTTINTGTMVSGNQLPSSGIVTASSSSIKQANNTINNQGIDKQFEDYQKNLNPIQKRMIAQNDPNVKTVVCYDASTGNKWFDVVNVQTGMSIPGIQRPAEFLLDDMRVDTRNAIAVNSNTNMTFPLVILGTRAADEL